MVYFLCMKKYILSFIVIFFFCFSLKVFAESIKKFDVDLNIDNDARVSIIENIYYDFGNNSRHGIFRYIPLGFSVKDQEKSFGLQKRKLIVDIDFVEMDGKKIPFDITKKDSNNNFFIKIGDPEALINGIHQYRIGYTVYGSLRYFDNFNEIYWNVTGNNWKVPIENVSVSLQINNASFDEYSCYIGSVGSNYPCSKKNNTGKKIYFAHGLLESNQGLTIAASFPKGAVLVDERYEWSILAFIITGFSLFAGIVLGIIYKIRKFMYKYRDNNVIYAQYEPPKDFSPIFVGYLFDKSFDDKDLSAGIIYLAQQGYIKIERIKTLSKEMFVPKFLSDFFVDYHFIRTDKKIKEDENQYEMYTIILDIIFSEKNKKEVLLSEISKSNAISQKNKLIKKIYKYFENNNYIEPLVNEKKLANIILINIPIFFIIVFLMIFFDLNILLIVVFLLFFLTILFMTIKRYTKKGWQVKNEILGFKEFLSMTEKERYEVLNNPVDNPQQFMEYLPYAIALGVEKKWAKQFESITFENPSWYSGNGEVFVATSFVSDISNMSSSLSEVSTPESSGSGSSGGGFSGGGSGGGGGGSW